MKKWILFHQNPVGDLIKYISSETKSSSFMIYRNFMNNFINNISIQNEKQFKEAIEYYKTILLYPETGEWEIKVFEKDTNEYTFEELCKANKKEEKKEKKTMLDKSKEFLDNFAKSQRKKNNFG